MLGAQHLDKALHRQVDRNRKNRRTWLHRLPYRLAAEFDNRLDEVPVPFLNDALFLTGFDQRVHGFRRCFRFFGRVLAGQSCYRLQKSQDDRNRHHQVDESLQNQRPSLQPLALGAREEYKREEAITQHDDQQKPECRLQNLIDAPILISKDQIGDQHRDRGSGQLFQNSHR